MIVAACGLYYQFVAQMMYAESSAHLTEIYHQTNQSLNSLVSKNWSTMRMWTPYLRDTRSEDLVEDFIRSNQQETGFTDFYFVSRDGEYLTVSGKSGRLDLKDSLPRVILNGENAVVSSVVPGQPEIMVFAVPAASNTYHGFAYEAIAISFNNSDLIRTLDISAFDGQSSSYVIRADGRVIADNASNGIREIYNFLGALREYSDMTAEEIEALRSRLQQERSGVTTFRMDGQAYYLVCEAADFEDWVLLGVVPTDIVNANMNAIQGVTLVVATAIAIILGVIMVIFLIKRYHRNLRRKDVELLYREELFSMLASSCSAPTASMWITSAPTSRS